MDKDSRTPSLSPVCYSTPDCQLTRDDSPLQSAAGGLAARHLPGMLVGKLLANCKHEFNKLHKRTCETCRLFCAASSTGCTKGLVKFAAYFVLLSEPLGGQTLIPLVHEV